MATADQALGDVDRAHAILLKQRDLQFHIVGAVPPKVSPFMAWLNHMLGPALKFMAPAAPYVFWSGLALGALVILYQLSAGWFGLRRGPVPGRFSLAAEGTWRPAPEQARALLQEADRLAEQGLYEEAAHLILLRSIEDIQSRRPRAVAPSLTSRDIAALAALPPAARDTFAGIALAVERSLFGGRPLDQAGFAQCRQAYEAFADASSWA